MVYNSLLTFFKEGGLVFMIPLLGLSILSLAVIIERTFFLGRQATHVKRFFSQHAAAVDVKALLTSSAKDPGRTIVGGILHDAATAMEKFNNRHTIERIIERYAEKYTPLLAERLWILRAIGQIAPFLGLTGTVVGLNISFHGIAEAGLNQRSVAEGIAIALNTTIMGLIIAVPTLFAEHCLKAWGQSQFRAIKTFLDEIILLHFEEKHP